MKEIFTLRLQGKAYSTIAQTLKKKYGKRFKINFATNRIHYLVSKKFYYGVFAWDGKEIIGSHKPLITKEVYDKANGI